MKDFQEFIDKKIIQKITSNKPRARDLFEESERKENSLNAIINKIGLSNENANDAVEYCYDIVLSLIRAKLYLDGFKSFGDGAHEAEVAYLIRLGFSRVDAEFMNELRYFRNRIKYYGKRLDKKYSSEVIELMRRVSSKLRSMFDF